MPWISTYVSYQQSLQPGTVVTNSGSTIYTNAGAILPPYRGDQYEVGAKATIGAGLLVTVAAYNINKANLYTQINPNGTQTYLEGGSIQDQGLEFTLTGKATPDLTLYGGATFENPRVHNNPSSPYQNGQLEQDASPISAKLYAEYNVPFVGSVTWLHNIVVTGGVSFTGPYHGNIRGSYAASPEIFPGYTVGDLGFRYNTVIDNHPVTLRFTVDNVANTGYWAATGLEGEPRTFLGSIAAKW